MSRIKENQEMLDKQPTKFTGKPEEVDLKIKMAQLAVLQDISKSLAVFSELCYVDEGDFIEKNELDKDELIKKYYEDFNNELVKKVRSEIDGQN